MEIDRKVDEEGLLASASEISGFIENEIKRGVDSRRIIIIGFSQGGAVAYQAALSHPDPLGGLLAMSSYFATSDSIQFNEANRRIPLEIQHGVYDPVVPESLGKTAAALLQDKGYAVNYRSYPMEHGVCPQQIVDISKWLQQVL
jgi:phospholipase/carboxylesterase